MENLYSFYMNNKTSIYLTNLTFKVYVIKIKLYGFLFFSFAFAFGQREPTAAFQVDSNTQGILPPRMTTAERDAILNPAQGLMIYDTNTKRLNLYNGTRWNVIGMGVTFKTTSGLISLTTDDVIPGDVVYNTQSRTLNLRSQDNKGWIVFKPDSSIHPDFILHKSPLDNVVQEYGLITSSTGAVWLDRNIGAKRKAAAYDDSSAFGHYFNWYEITTGPFASTICPTGFRLPTKAEWDTEAQKMNSNNIDYRFQAFSHLALPSSGWRHASNQATQQPNIVAYFWTSDSNPNPATGAYNLTFGVGTNNTRTFTHLPTFHFSVRCIKN